MEHSLASAIEEEPMIRNIAWMSGALLIVAAAGCGSEPDPTEITAPEAAPLGAKLRVTAKQSVGLSLFSDTNLSSPSGQSCASCHTLSHGAVDPDSGIPTSEGAVAGRFGNRNTPTAFYAQYSPPFHYDADDETYVGGQFWDGRASSLEDQAKGPFLNPIEMNNPSKAAVVAKVKNSSYAPTFKQVYGGNVFADVNAAYDDIADAIATFERMPNFAPFNSRYDAYLAGTGTLTAQELSGLALFEDPAKGNCSACHPSRAAADGTPPLFTDFTYDNLGIPRNPNNPFYSMPPQFNPAGAGFVDHGLAGPLGDPAQDGRFKVSTLRNLGKTGPYGHNGYFPDLHTVVDFYNTRDVSAWPAAEIPATVNHDELGNLGLSAQEVDDIVAFLGTLDDRSSDP
jgi:cytochrome c peroxidase